MDAVALVEVGCDLRAGIEVEARLGVQGDTVDRIGDGLDGPAEIDYVRTRDDGDSVAEVLVRQKNRLAVEESGGIGTQLNAQRVLGDGEIGCGERDAGAVVDVDAEYPVARDRVRAGDDQRRRGFNVQAVDGVALAGAASDRNTGVGQGDDARQLVA